MLVEELSRLVRQESSPLHWVELPLAEWEELLTDALRIDGQLREQDIPNSCLYANLDYLELGLPSIMICGVAVLPDASLLERIVH